MPNLSESWARLGIRKQLTGVAVTVVAIPMTLGILLLANLLTNALANAQIETSHEVLHRTVTHVREKGPTDLPGELQLDDGYRAQVLDAGGRLVWTSSGRYLQPFTEQVPEPGQTVQEGAVKWWGPGDKNEHRDLVLSQGLTWKGHDYVVTVATSQEDEHSAVTLTVGLLMACMPLVLLTAGLTSWWVAGRALRPVDVINSRAAQITSRTLDERVPVPPSEDELQDLAITMNQMLGRLEAAQQAQRRFISDASHELRSPMASLSGALEIACAEDDIETWRELSPLMQTEADRLNLLVHDLLELSRADDAGVQLSRRELDLDDVASAEASRLRSASELDVVAHIRAARVLGDGAKLSQVLRNLCDNAARHARTTVRITVEPTSDGGALARVEDDGNGIAPEDRDRVFERFVRLQESRSRDDGGSGIGLAIVQQIIQGHDGTITVGESPLGGALFEVRLPDPSGASLGHSIASR
ncbi:HAMP domain-containing sensor histidine kinase [Luteococcus sp. Sow4_B9]|uniref:HAMP domain-containing sensor histidine kinase n=1 Tax=Luteococcus sp. Sow4_B9 TaxID=3438792 RepID=UPI003F9674DE